MHKSPVIALVLSLSAGSASAWTIEKVEDKMTGKTHVFASSLSKNSASLGFPYGTIRPELVVRSHPRHGKDVVFVAGDGQIPCRSYSPCSILVKFDARKPIKFGGIGPSDGTSSTVFIQGYKRFIDEMMKSKTAIIEVEFYRAGNQQFEFDVSGLDRKSSGL